MKVTIGEIVVVKETSDGTLTVKRKAFGEPLVIKGPAHSGALHECLKVISAINSIERKANSGVKGGSS